MSIKNILKNAVVIGVVAVVTWYFSISAGLLWGLFLLFALFDFDSRIVGVMAIIALATCPILLSLGKDELAEERAIYAFFFLTITVVLQLIELVRRPERFKDDMNTHEKT